MFEKIPTGVEGLDVMLKGGLIKGRTYLIKGGPGTGKTILSMHFLVEGAKRGENVVYITLEEPENEVRENMETLGFDLSNVTIVDLSPTSGHPIFSSLMGFESGIDVKTFENILQDIIGDNIDRVVIDSITMLKVATPTETEYRASLLRLMRTLKVKFNATTVLISELGNGVEDYLVNGMIELRTIEVKGRAVRGIKIVKMRGSDFDETIRPYRITNRGIEVYPDLSVFEV
ncbi:RAD55 family ATPase [Archaeoglobus profundus]|uniref:RAD55 family ATPase n=1 Tax=Archaeoglobus profundus TaxID=84156 RepID=UPI000A459FE0|nr:ATPase domain-containing protein [Archaeoglobus profundus]